MNDKNRIFTLKDKDGNDMELIIKNPGLKDREEAESLRIRTWNRAIADKAPFAENLGKVLREQGLWDDTKEQKLIDLRLELTDIFDRLDKGGFKLSEARKLAIKARDIRNEINLVTFDRIRYASTTVEGLSSDKEFQFLVSCMVYYNKDNKRYFKDFNDYLNRTGDVDAYMISNKVSEILYGGSEENYTENKFLKEQGFVDEKLRLINSDGHLIDKEGKLVNEDGDYIKYNEDGTVVIIDKDGNLIETKIEKKPFLNEDGTPIIQKE